jgi:Fur family ferric uptake transcriptional regulator
MGRSVLGRVAKFNNYLAANGLKSTRQRHIIAGVFFSLKKHISAEELYERVSKRDSSIGLVTVYRTLKLLTKAGLAKERQFGGGKARFEPALPDTHHDHLICTECGTIVEFESAKIEKMQTELANEHGFRVFDHKLELYGLCSACQQR